MKDKNKLILAIIAVIAIVAIVGGASFAYWTWITAEEQETGVTFTVKIDGLYAKLDGSGTLDVSNLKPVNCTDSNYENFGIKKKIEIIYKNDTTQSATVSPKLQMISMALRDGSIKPTANTLKYLRYALTTSESSCGVTYNSGSSDFTYSTSVVAKDLAGNYIQGSFANLIKESGETMTPNTLPTFSGTTASNLPLTLFTQTFTAPALMTAEATQTYYLWIWLDASYAHQNVGSTNSDPMQDLTFTTEWTGKVSQNES